MRFLIFSDLHGDAVTAGMRRTDDYEAALAEVAELATGQAVDEVVCLGDLCDPDAGSILLRVLDVTMAFAARLGAAGIATTWVRGNHDTVEDGSDFSTLRPLRHVHRAKVFDQPSAIVYGARNLVEAVLLPYPTRASKYDPEAYLREHPFRVESAKRVVFGHMTSIPGAKMGSEGADFARGGDMPFPVAECKRQGVDLMANGHLHHAQVTPDGVHVPGSLLRLRFDEEHNVPAALIVNV